MLRPSLASRASHLARVSLNHSNRGKRASSCRNERTVAAAAVASGAGIILLLSTRTATTPREPNGVRTQPSRTVQTSSIFTRASIDPELNPQIYLYNVFTRRPIHITRCDDDQGDDEQDTNDDDNEEEEQLLPLNDNGEDSNDITGYTEAESFYQCLDYHRSLLSDYRRRWGTADLAAEEEDEEDEGHKEPAHDKPAQTANNKTSKRNQSSWPRRVPTDDEINALETDLKFCLRLPTNDTDKSVSCHNLQFRVAAYYVAQDDPVAQRRGFKKIKQLAEQGYPDGMCYYGVLLNEGKIAGVDANPRLAVVWFRRCVDYHRHIKAMYELATANYLGEGTPENPETAVKLYRRAAHLGHAGAAYMLGECLLDGVGADRDRENALEWLVTAAELGHALARQRVFAILMEEYENLDAGQAHEQRKQEEAEKWVNLREEQKFKRVNIERRFSIGGGSRNPKIMARRRTKVKESRDEAPL